jgi:polyphosphate kinase
MAVNKKNKYINREISWLSFNERVLQEAADNQNPLIERLRFLGIFSNNLDEFFRVRFASMKRMMQYEPNTTLIGGQKPKQLLKQIQDIVLQQRFRFDEIYNEILKGLEQHNVFLINEHELNDTQVAFVKKYYLEKVRPVLIPIMLDKLEEFPALKDRTIYLAVKLSNTVKTEKRRYSLIEIPTNVLPRFIHLPSAHGEDYIILLDDIIRFNMKDIFFLFDYDSFEAYTVKITRDAELDVDHDVSKSLLENLSKSVKKRELGQPVRLIYDYEIPKDLLKFMVQRIKLSEVDNIVSGGRYHNFKDFISFPSLGKVELNFPEKQQLPHDIVSPNHSVFAKMREQDILLHYPYQSFNHFIDFLREAAIDPKVESIHMTLYRIAKNSAVANALLNAKKNGKEVTVVIELQARFDEESNIYWSQLLQEEGVNIIYGVKNHKVHCKMCLVNRREKGQLVQYVNISTGNYHDSTSKIYTDKSLLTCNPRITREIARLFDFFENNLKTGRYRELMVAPFSMRQKIVAHINNEIKNAKAGKKAFIYIKLNALVDEEMIDKLYLASQAGVKIKIICRSICSLVPGVKGLSENIEVISIVGRFLEHNRMMIFHNSGNELYYIMSSDWMVRNLDHRIEVACPIFDKKIQQELKDILEMQFKDNVKARIIDAEQTNKYVKATTGKRFSAQEEIYNYLKHKLEVTTQV